jgi:hypothetical protein
MQLNKISMIGKGPITTCVWKKLVYYKFLDTGLSIENNKYDKISNKISAIDQNQNGV